MHRDRASNHKLRIALALALVCAVAACGGDSRVTPTVTPAAPPSPQPTAAVMKVEPTFTPTPAQVIELPTKTPTPDPTVAVVTATVPEDTPTPTAAPSPTPKPPTSTPTAGPIVSVSGATLDGNPVAASAVAVSPDGAVVIAVNPDSDSITVVNALTLEVLAEVSVGADPRTVSITPDSNTILVSNHRGSTVSIVDLTQFAEVAQWPVGPMPYGVVTDGVHAFVSEFALGHVSVLDITTGALLSRIPVDPFPAGLALSGDGRILLATHFFTGGVTAIDVQTSTVLGTASTGANTNLSQFIALAPDGTRAYLPQTRSNTTNTALLFDTTVFPVVNVLDLGELRLLVRERITLDTADEPVNMPFAVAITPDGGTLYLANAGSDDVSVIDLATNRGLAHLKVGANPRGIAITPDGSRVFVNNVLDGTLSVMDADTFDVTDTVKLTDIPLDPTVLLGKRIFNSASEPVLTTDNWISCATCHFDGTMDARTWLGFPDGPRNTPSLFGVGETLPIHWSGDLDELQDVELTIRVIQSGEGLVLGEAHDSLGSPHTGLSEELDALAVYMASLKVRPSPYAGDREAVPRGDSTFTALTCQTCHVPPLYTDLQLHDVGTGDPALEKNSHGRGTNFDTPTLRGLWLTEPYLHDGSALTLEEVFQAGTTHDIFSRVTSDELRDLIAFLRALPYDE